MTSRAPELEPLNLQGLIDCIPALIHSALPDGNLDFFNQGWQNYLGLPMEEIAGWKWTATIHPEDVTGMVAKWRESLASGEPFECEARVRRADGEYRWMAHRKVPVRGERGNIVRWYGFSADIEDRKRVEDALRLSETCMAQAQRLTRVGSRVIKVPDTPEYWSPVSFEIFGINPDDGPPKNTAEFLLHVHPDDREAVGRARAEIFPKGLVFDYKYRIVRPNGDVRVIRDVGSPVSECGAVKCYVGAWMDITDQEQKTEELGRSQFYLAEAQRLAQMGVWAFNPAGFFDFWSKELFLIYGLDPTKESPTLAEYLDCIHAEDRDFMARLIEKMVAEGLGCDVTKRIVRPSSEVRYIRCVGVPVIENGALKRIVGTAIDVTERKQAEEALLAARAELERITRVTNLGQLAASIAHEINQPLAAVVSNVGASLRWLAKQPLELDRARQGLERAREESVRAGEIVNRIRALIKKSPQRKEWVDVNKTISEIIELARTELHRNDVSLSTRLSTDLPLVQGDKIQLQQVILNLITNAMEAMNGLAPAELMISSAKHGSDGVVVSIADSGRGIKDGSVDQLFEAFYTTKADGVGMGLAISRSIISAHGGRIWATPNTPRGAIFKFTLPPSGRSSEEH